MGFLTASRDANAKLDALNRSQAVIEFNLGGTIITAKQNFLNAMGYPLEEGQAPQHVRGAGPARQRRVSRVLGCAAPWRVSGAGVQGVAKGGRPLWIQASYNPLMNARGKPYKVVKFATDITDQKLRNADYEGQLKAFHKSQAVIEFNLDGTIITANDNFLKTIGYSLDEIRGKHHRVFVEPQERESSAYRAFWEALGRGEYQASEYKRVGKGDSTVWIQASYNPIHDADGKIMKVVKFATDITAQVEDRIRRADLQKTIDNDLGEITASVATTSERVTSAVSASTQASSNMQAVAAGAEELAASVGEISRQSADALAISQQAVTQANETSGIVSGLATAAQKIGDVVKLINNIAEQTNLLALNATIEAGGRAGFLQSSRLK